MEESRTVAIIIPVGIPGMGKTRLSQDLVSHSECLNARVDVISNDCIRKEAIDKILPEISSRHEGFLRTQEQVIGEFYHQLERLMHEGTGRNRQVIYLDKNHIPDTCQESVVRIRQVFMPEVKTIIIGVIPACKGRVHVEGTVFPFSTQFIAQCISRVVSREGHESLVGDLEHRIGVVLKLCRSFEGIADLGEFLTALGVDHVIPYSFTHEHSLGDSSDLLGIVQNLLQSTDQASDAASPQMLATMALNLPEESNRPGESDLSTFLGALSNLLL